MSHLYSCDLAHCNVKDSIMYYRPSLAANAAFLALFAFSGIAHIAQGTVTRKPYFLGAMVCGCTGEVIGYIGRLLSWNNPFSLNGFLIGICCITIAPAFFAAALYFTLGDVVRHVSVDSSRIKPKTYAMIFIPCDLVSLILQGAGGGLASVASQNNKDVTNPTHVMVAGLAFQVATMAAFIAIGLDYALRVWKLQKRSGVTLAPHISKRKLTLFATFFSLAVVTIFIRTVYRVIELADGWTSKLYRTQTDYIVLEGVMVVIAVYALHIGHPGNLGKGYISTSPPEAKLSEEGKIEEAKQ